MKELFVKTFSSVLQTHSFTLKTGKLEHAGIFVVEVSSSYFGKGEKI
jgi:hypothetical protein